MKGIKAFNKDMTCNGFQFEEKKTYEEKRAVLCESGFHFCENPFDVLRYYDLCGSEFAEVEAIGEIDTNKNGDSKHTTTKIKIGVKIGIGGFVKHAVDFLIAFCKKNNEYSSGDSSQLAASGYSSQLAASGDSSQLAASGYYSQLAIEGKYSVGAGIGIDNMIKGKKGTWITLAEWKYDNDKERYIPACVKSAQIDGKKLKEDVFYKLENKKFVEVK